MAMVILAGACGSDAEASGPPDIVEGRTMCDECGMLIDDVRFAASYRTADGEERRFDDIGGMLNQGQRNGDLETAEIWVHDYESGEPLPVAEATYVMADDVMTPMGWGILAFRSADEAQRLAEMHGASVLIWSDLLKVMADGELLPPGLRHQNDSHGEGN
ncbi:MAG: hypothetical protein GY929_04235 [Actinomycetia bacterium]|nr:hypothetical protein [Actinomycetes bacterium]